jgi:hypothetical protein
LAAGHEQLKAIQDFDRLRERAIIQELIGAITKAPAGLLPFEEVREKLHIREAGERGLRDIPLDKIVGSVGRYHDFTRTFLPRRSADRHRWATLKKLATGMQGWPPIQVYQVGDVYFVQDGNHRVSVAMDMGMKTIEAYVTECVSPVPLDPGDTPADIILKADRADFLMRTDIERLRPDHGIQMTLPGRYQVLLAHIAAHQFFLDQQSGQPISWEEATISWYDNVYVPLVRLIQEKHLLRQFPHRTPADLYAWTVEHELELRELCDVSRVDDRVALDDFAASYSERPIIAQIKAILRFFDRKLGRRRSLCES